MSESVCTYLDNIDFIIHCDLKQAVRFTVAHLADLFLNRVKDLEDLKVVILRRDRAQTTRGGYG